MIHWWRPFAIRQQRCHAWPAPPRLDAHGMCRANVGGSHHIPINRSHVCRLAPAPVSPNPWKGAPPSGQHGCLYRNHWPPAKLPSTMLYAMLSPQLWLSGSPAAAPLGKSHALIAVSHQSFTVPLAHTWGTYRMSHHQRTRAVRVFSDSNALLAIDLTHAFTLMPSLLYIAFALCLHLSQCVPPTRVHLLPPTCRTRRGSTMPRAAPTSTTMLAAHCWLATRSMRLSNSRGGQAEVGCPTWRPG